MSSLPARRQQADVSGALERARERDEVLVLYAHGITRDGTKDPHNISGEQLEALLARAAALRLPIIGLDELDGLGR